MSFIQFAKSYGLIIKDLIANNRWQRVPTLDHPNKTNGAYIYNGISGACQNWSVDTKPHIYKNNDAIIDAIEYKAIQNKSINDKNKLNEAAAKKAAYMIKNSSIDFHPYLIKKGFEDLKGYVNDGKLLIPMRINNKLVGLQIIDNDGDKKFIYGQVTNMATFNIGNKGVNVLCEGFATGQSVFKALKIVGIDCKIHICFSVGNMLKVSQTLSEGLVIADNDKSLTGENTAKKIGWPYWISETEGNDFNDESMYKSYFKLSQELKKLLIKHLL